MFAGKDEQVGAARVAVENQPVPVEPEKQVGKHPENRAHVAVGLEQFL